MKVLHLKNWESKDQKLIGTNSKYTAPRMVRFWMLIKDAFQDWDKEQMRLSYLPKVDEHSAKQKQRRHFREHTCSSDRFKWNPRFTKFRLPVPSSKPSQY